MSSNVLNGFRPEGTIPGDITTPLTGIVNPCVLNGPVYVKNKLVDLEGGAGFPFENTIFVAKGGDDSNNGEINSPKLTFQGAVDTTDSDSTYYSIFCFDSGIYDQSLSITDRRISIFAPNASLTSSSGDTITVDDTTSTSTVININCYSLTGTAGNAITTMGSGSPTTTELDRVFVNCELFSGNLLSEDISIQLVADRNVLDTTFNTPTGDGLYTAEIKTVGVSGTITVEDETTISGNIAGVLYGPWQDSIQTLTFTVDFNDLSGPFELLPGLLDRNYRVKDILLSSVGTNFSGGDRDLTIGDSANTVLYSTIPAATMQSLSDAKWGSTEIPFPSLGGVNSQTNTGSALRLIYSGGSSDYTAGELTISVVYEKINV